MKYTNSHIYAMHDLGAEVILAGNGWLVATEALGTDANDYSGRDYTHLGAQGLGVIVRLNNGYEPVGTIPDPGQYASFAKRVGNFVANSPGCDIWIIGNETNLARERPYGVPILPSDYASCFLQCRAQIKMLAGHQDDTVLVAGPGPWNAETTYPANVSGSWCKYLQDQVEAIGKCQTGGIALHTYSHGHDPELVVANDKMNPPFDDCHYHFRTYKDFCNALKEIDYLNKPLFITEANADVKDWPNGNNGWVQKVYEEINYWNTTNPQQVISCVALFRWMQDPYGWTISDKPGVMEDFILAMNHNYTWNDKVQEEG